MPPRSYASQGRRTRVPSSNRDQKNLPLMRFSSIIYGRQEAKRWDTTELSSDLILASSYPIRKFLASNIVTEKRVWPDKTRGKRSPGRLVATLCADYANADGPHDDSSRGPSISELPCRSKETTSEQSTSD